MGCFFRFLGVLSVFLTLGLFHSQTVCALDPVISSAYGGGYYHFENASPAYRHGVKTPFNSYPQMPQIPTAPSEPNLPVVPVPTMADLLPNPQNAPHPYIGVDGVGCYSDEVMSEYNPDLYRNPNPDHRNLHHHATDNPQEIPQAYSDDSRYADDRNAEADVYQAGSTDKPMKKTQNTKKSKKTKKTPEKKENSAADENI